MAATPGTTKQLTPVGPAVYPAVIASNAAAGNQLFDPSVESERNNPLRHISLRLALALVFLRISAFHQVEAYLLHVNLRLLYVVGIPAVLGTVLCGGLQRSFRGKPAFYWTAYSLWLFATIPTAFWRGGALLHAALPYLRTDVIMLFVVAGLIIDWKECKSLMTCFAWGAFGTLMVARLFQNPAYQERFGLELGTIANPNDFACHLLLVLPFLYWAVLTSKSLVARLVSLGGIAYGIYLIIQTASRGALVGLVVVMVFILCWGSLPQRLAVIVLAPIAFLILVSVVPSQTLNRIVSFRAGSVDVSQEAMESSASRRYLLEKSIEYAIKFPIFGLGPGNFPFYEGKNNVVIGTHGSFHGTHNTFTQVASECGFPGLVLYLGGLVSSFALFYSAFRKASQRPDCPDIQAAVMCIMLGMIGFVIASTFLNFAYFFYQPLLGGMAIAFARGTNEEFAKRDLARTLAPQSTLTPAGTRKVNFSPSGSPPNSGYVRQ